MPVCSRRVLSLFGIVAILSGWINSSPLSAEEPRPAAKSNLKILTWNIQMLPTFGFLSEDLQKKQAVRAPWIIEYLNQQDFDIVALEEVIDRKITEELKEGLKSHYPHIVAPPSKSGISGTSGGILIASRIPLTYVSHIVYKNVAGVDRLAEKGCLMAAGERDGVRFQIAATHLQAGHNEMKEKQIPEIWEGILKPNLQEGVPQFLVGDMNVASDVDDERPRWRMLLATTHMHEFPTDDPRPWSVDNENSWSRPSKQGERIDHVLLNPSGTGTKIQRQTIQRVWKEYEGRRMDYADHYGVIAEVLLQK
jgi:endonuclease/exonuclease/phosphatase family metal-dependent hydrolase